MKRTAWILMLLIAAFSLGAPGIALGQGESPAPLSSVTVRIPVQQIFSTNKTGVADRFYYVLEAQTEGAPLPAGSRQGRYAFEMNGNAALDLKMEMKQAGQYVYRLYQTVENERANYRYDRTVYQVTVYAYQDKNNQLAAAVVIYGGDEGKVSKAVFQNAYEEVKPAPTPSDGDGGDVQTGDENQLGGYIALMIFCALGLCLLAIWVSRKKDGQGGNTTYEK